MLDMLLLAQDVREFVTAMPFEVFSGDKKTKAAVLHALIVIGEASSVSRSTSKWTIPRSLGYGLATFAIC